MGTDPTSGGPPAAGRPRRATRGGGPGARLLYLVLLLYVFLVGVESVSNGIAGFGESVTDGLFRSATHPLGGLSVGILATVLVQSSSVTTSMIVAMVGGGVIDLDAAIPMVMGANIGTTITNTLVSLGALRRPTEFRRAFAGATVHDAFNLLCVAVLLPLELATGFLAWAAVRLSDLVGDARGGELSSPVGAVVSYGSDAVEAVAQRLGGGGALTSGVVLAAGFVLVLATLLAITRTMKVVMAGRVERSLNRVLGRGGGLGILVGAVLTVALQSSSIMTALLVPMIAAGVLEMRAAYPLTLGANIGTTATALIAALAVPQIAGLQIALVHLLFNVTGTLLFYPAPALRAVPPRLAELLADQAVRRRSAVVVYVVGVFVVLPLIGALVLR